MPRLIRHLSGLAALIFSLTLSSASHADAQADAQAEYEAANIAWGKVLEEYVDSEGRTDFIGLSENISDLDTYVETVAELGPNTNPDLFDTDEKIMAYHINTYNALAMKGVIERGIPAGFTSFFKRASFFKFRKVRLDGDKTDLYTYENKVIRPLDEPRSHFALNCMVRDCPRLPREPFSAETLDASLDELTREFFSKTKHLRIDHEHERVYVSAILDFYTKDFVSSGRRADLPDYINPYLEQPLPEDYSVHYIDYDWRINQSPSD
ncbi:MAG: DUF547 domain-containing protein [Halioglobus sp.]